MALGGKRAGAGRKPGSKQKPHISDYWTKDQIASFFNDMYKRQKKDARIAVWCGDQLSGKATQAITGADGGPVEITLVKYANSTPPPLRT
jgi:hypothetical protein